MLVSVNAVVGGVEFAVAPIAEGVFKVWADSKALGHIFWSPGNKMWGIEIDSTITGNTRHVNCAPSKTAEKAVAHLYHAACYFTARRAA